MKFTQQQILDEITALIKTDPQAVIGYMADAGVPYSGTTTIDLAKAVGPLLVNNPKFTSAIATRIATDAFIQQGGYKNSTGFYHNAGGGAICTDPISCIVQGAGNILQGIGSIAQAVSAPIVAQQTTKQVQMQTKSADYVADDQVTIALLQTAAAEKQAQSASAASGLGSVGGGSGSTVLILVLVALGIGGLVLMSGGKKTETK